MSKIKISFLFFLFSTLMACHSSDEDAKPSSVSSNASSLFRQPAHFPAPTYTFAQNPITQKGFDLGKMLFFDGILSQDSSISCASCHIPTSAFTQHGHAVSHGIRNQNGTRNSLPLFNLAWNSSFMSDGGIPLLDFVAINAIQNPKEMDETVPHVLYKLNRTSKYPPLFREAFGTTDTITSIQFLHALSQFMLCIVSDNTAYDRFVRGDSTALNQDQKDGLLLVRKNCVSCHKEPLFTSASFKNNGIQGTNILDKGLGSVTFKPEDDGKFAIPTFRNLAYTLPYMHNGQTATLDAVLDHYTNLNSSAKGVDASLLTAEGTSAIVLTLEEKRKILTFLNALNDRPLLTDPRFAEQ